MKLDQQQVAPQIQNKNIANELTQAEEVVFIAAAKNTKGQPGGAYIEGSYGVRFLSEFQ